MTDAAARPIEHIVVVGYDHWTEAVLKTLERVGLSHALIVTDDVPRGRLETHDAPVVYTESLNEAAFLEAGTARADAVLVATFDDSLNVLAVLTAVDVTDDAIIATFTDERRDATKLRRAGADTVVNLGSVVAELIVDTALTGDDPRTLLDELLTDESVVDTGAIDEAESSDDAMETGTETGTETGAPEDAGEPTADASTTASTLATESIDVDDDTDGHRS